MAGLQRSAVSFRRQGSSGLVWDDRFISGELNQVANQQKEEEDHHHHHHHHQQQQQQQQELNQRQEISQQESVDVKDGKPSRGLEPIRTIDRSRSNGGGRGYRTGKVSPAIEPPSPRVSACGFCNAFGNKPKGNNRRTAAKSGKRRSR
ncbi:MAPK kinase substrate protein At1g80180-like [Carica papaya]|uniref:MAPK kinase substrate protein At1g80180-like n=1 Tax=Carica papaya TaxID=3649 RepID=UPI000B8C95F4|nr:MAPK kinase substrate protein At1g80180-like [Carica papaya]